jgi:hypothetical protein
MILCDPASERAVLAGICAYGEDAYLDTVDIIQESSFTIDSNGVIYKCIKNNIRLNSKVIQICQNLFHSGFDFVFTRIYLYLVCKEG